MAPYGARAVAQADRIAHPTAPSHALQAPNTWDNNVI